MRDGYYCCSPLVRVARLLFRESHGHSHFSKFVIFSNSRVHKYLFLGEAAIPGSNHDPIHIHTYYCNYQTEVHIKTIGEDMFALPR